MNKLIAVAGLGAAITLGSLVGAGTASASEAPWALTSRYLNNAGLPVMSSGLQRVRMLRNLVYPYSLLTGNRYGSYVAGAIISSAQYGLCRGTTVT